LKARCRVLRKLGYIDSEQVVQTKGHVACEISTSDELVTTELVFSGVLKTLSLEQVVALISCLVWTEKADGKIREDLQGPVRTLRDIVRRIGKTQQDCKMERDIQDYVDSFSPALIDMAYAWCRGAKFSEVMKLIPDIFEGSLVRAMRRLEELMGQIAVASHFIGDVDLETKMNDAREKMKRDIVFAASLYL